MAYHGSHYFVRVALVSTLVWIATLNSACDGGAKLVVVSYGGGAYQESHKTAFLTPFQTECGCKVESVVWGAEYGRLQDMVTSQNVVWDVVEVTAAQYSRGNADGLFAELPRGPRLEEFVALPGGPEAEKFGVPNVYWSTVLAFRRDKFSSEQPLDWTSFWDVVRFPGPRALYDDPRGNLEFALLADGVRIENLYPLDVERAFHKLDEIKPSVRVWWKDGTEPVQLLLADQVSLTSAWSGRIFASQRARGSLGYIWSGAAHELDYWVVPRGSKNVELGADFIVFASQPRNMAKQADVTAYGPANRNALQFVSEAVRPHLPTSPENWATSFAVDSSWWAENETQMATRWIEWKNR